MRSDGRVLGQADYFSRKLQEPVLVCFLYIFPRLLCQLLVMFRSAEGLGAHNFAPPALGIQPFRLFQRIVNVPFELFAKLFQCASAMILCVR